MSVMRESRDTEGEKSHVVFTIKKPNEKKKKKCSFSTWNKPRSTTQDSVKPTTSPSL